MSEAVPEPKKKKTMVGTRVRIRPASMSSEKSSTRTSEDSEPENRAAQKRRRLSPPEENVSLPSIISRIDGTQATRESRLASIYDDTRLNPRSKPITSFASLNVQPWLVASLAAMAITRPTPIQRECIPRILEGRDCIGGSRTGSGKTVAFAIPIIQKWAEDPFGIFAVVLTPTRYELAPKSHLDRTLGTDQFIENLLFKCLSNSKPYLLLNPSR